GAYLDPVADKLLLVSVFIMLGYLGALPLWLIALAVSRDLMIVGGVIVSSVIGNPVRMRPLIVSKVNTAAQMVLAVVTLAELSGWSEVAPVGNWLVWLVALLTIASAAAYLVG